ncbi:MAG TPA: hypothetical protein VHZ55_12000 [Bryobacteraceae bacterium]|jgi:hypothetical protein|nr:hypothetical protein [Bryobacteraceae bacterium]
MSAPLVPSPLDYVGRRRFAFYPAISHLAPNEWLLGTGSHSEVQVVNAQTGREVWIARQYIGGVSETAESLLVVGLTKALEYQGGSVTPQVRRIIEMPAERANSQKAWKTEAPRLRPAAVVGIKLETKSDSAWGKALAAACIAALVLALLAALVTATIKF